MRVCRSAIALFQSLLLIGSLVPPPAAASEVFTPMPSLVATEAVVPGLDWMHMAFARVSAWKEREDVRTVALALGTILAGGFPMMMAVPEDAEFAQSRAALRTDKALRQALYPELNKVYGKRLSSGDHDRLWTSPDWLAALHELLGKKVRQRSEIDTMAQRTGRVVADFVRRYKAQAQSEAGKSANAQRAVGTPASPVLSEKREYELRLQARALLTNPQQDDLLKKVSVANRWRLHTPIHAMANAATIASELANQIRKFIGTLTLASSDATVLALALAEPYSPAALTQALDVAPRALKNCEANIVAAFLELTAFYDLIARRQDVGYGDRALGFAKIAYVMAYHLSEPMAVFQLHAAYRLASALAAVGKTDESQDIAAHGAVLGEAWLDAARTKRSTRFSREALLDLRMSPVGIPAVEQFTTRCRFYMLQALALGPEDPAIRAELLALRDHEHLTPDLQAEVLYLSAYLALLQRDFAEVARLADAVVPTDLSAKQRAILLGFVQLGASETALERQDPTAALEHATGALAQALSQPTGASGDAIVRLLETGGKTVIDHLDSNQESLVLSQLIVVSRAECLLGHTEDGLRAARAAAGLYSIALARLAVLNAEIHLAARDGRWEAADEGVLQLTAALGSLEPPERRDAEHYLVETRGVLAAAADARARDRHDAAVKPWRALVDAVVTDDAQRSLLVCLYEYVVQPVVLAAPVEIALTQTEKIRRILAALPSPAAFTEETRGPLENVARYHPLIPLLGAHASPREWASRFGDWLIGDAYDWVCRHFHPDRGYAISQDVRRLLLLSGRRLSDDHRQKLVETIYDWVRAQKSLIGLVRITQDEGDLSSLHVEVTFHPDEIARFRIDIVDHPGAHEEMNAFVFPLDDTTQEIMLQRRALARSAENADYALRLAFHKGLLRHEGYPPADVEALAPLLAEKGKGFDMYADAGTWPFEIQAFTGYLDGLAAHDMLRARAYAHRLAIREASGLLLPIARAAIAALDPRNAGATHAPKGHPKQTSHWRFIQRLLGEELNFLHAFASHGAESVDEHLFYRRMLRQFFHDIAATVVNPIRALSALDAMLTDVRRRTADATTGFDVLHAAAQDAFRTPQESFLLWRIGVTALRRFGDTTEVQEATAIVYGLGARLHNPALYETWLGLVLRIEHPAFVERHLHAAA